MTQQPYKKAAPKLVRQINRTSILEIVKNEGPISRSEIARKTKFSKVTVSSIIRSLLAENLIQEGASQTSARGVKPILYSLNRDDYLFGAISIDSNQTTVAIVNMESKIIAKEHFPTITGTNNSENFLNYCIDRFKLLENKKKVAKLVGIGTSITGTLDFQKQELVHSINLNWQHVPILKIFKNKINEKVIIENDTRCTALAEWTFSPNPAIRDSDIFIFIKSGVACNLKINNRIYTGRHNLCCEFGHLIINAIHDQKDSEDSVYLKDYISDRATIKYYHQLTNDSYKGDVEAEMEWILRQAQMQQPAAEQTVRRFIKYLAIGIANLVNLFDPGGIIIHSKITRIWDLVYNDLLSEISKYTLHQEEKHFSLYPSSLNNNAAIIGAATLIIRHFTRYPDV